MTQIQQKILEANKNFRGGIKYHEVINVLLNGKSQPVLRVCFNDNTWYFINKRGGFGGAAIRLAQQQIKTTI